MFLTGIRCIKSCAYNNVAIKYICKFNSGRHKQADLKKQFQSSQAVGHSKHVPFHFLLFDFNILWGMGIDK